MVNLADNGISCECGSDRLVASGSGTCVGGFCICATCGQTFSITLALVPVAWGAMAEHLSEVDYISFGWTRRGLSAPVLARLEATGGKFRKSDRAGVALGAVGLLVMLLVLARAVWS